MARRGLRIAVLACLAAVAAPAFGARPVPTTVSSYLLGAKMIRGEFVVKATGLHDYRLDRGKLLRRYAAGSLNLLQRDGTKTPVKVASSARVFLNGAPSTLRRLRAGMQIAVAHDGDLPSGTVFAGSKQAPKWAPSMVALMLGNRLVRAEIALKDTVLHDYRLDHGRIKDIGFSTLLLREPDGSEVTINISPNVRVRLNGKNASFFQLRTGMMATTLRDGDKPADQVFATGR